MQVITNLKQHVTNKIADFLFSDGAKLVDKISEIIIKDNNIGFAIDITGYDIREAKALQSKVVKELMCIPNIGKVTVVLTNQSQSDQKTNNTEHKPRALKVIDGAKKVILVAAGKGGVGKSTVAALIAQQLTAENFKVGMVDADIYGPSIPKIFGTSKLPEIVDNKMIPLEAMGVQIMSIGFLTKDDSAIAWRGPMASKALYQLLSLTLWDNLDYLIIDMPPGTGDIHLSILENYLIDGAVIVTSPQKLSEIDVVKAINLYQKFSIPILGIVENMSYFVDAAGNKIQIFSGNSGRDLANTYKVPLICHLPIIPAISKCCDQGQNLLEIVQIPTKELV